MEVSRCKETFNPFREYHTSEDSLKNINWGKVKEFYNVIEQSIKEIDKSVFYKRKFTGLPCLSNPKIDLYIERPDPAVKKKIGKEESGRGSFGDSVLRYLGGSTSTKMAAKHHGLPVKFVSRFLWSLHQKKLVGSR